MKLQGMKAECAYDYVRIDDHEKLCGEFSKLNMLTKLYSYYVRLCKTS